jgi:hypothetical protein
MPEQRTELIETGYRRVAGAKEGVTRALTRKTHVWFYNIADLRHRYAGRWKRSILLLFVQAALIITPYALTHPAIPFKTLRWIGLAILASNSLIVIEVNASRTQKIGELKNERKIRTANIIDLLAKRFSPVKFTEFEAQSLRQEVLLAICSSIASSLGMDPNGFMASLVIRSPHQPEGLTVIARSSASRPILASYPKEGMVAWDAIERRQVEITGDVTREYEGFASRPYRSVISFPIIIGGEAVAAVNVDHGFKFLFDERGLLFQTNLRPYLRLIALSLSNINVIQDSTEQGDAP